jgi:hypothetical protein
LRLGDLLHRFHGGLLLYDGVETTWLSERILGVPWHRVI